MSKKKTVEDAKVKEENNRVKEEPKKKLDKDLDKKLEETFPASDSTAQY